MDRRAAIVLSIIFGGLFLALFAFLVLAISLVDGGGARRFGGGTGNIGVVEIKGPITESDETVENLDAFGKDDRIHAVIVRVESPGGSIGPSQEINAEIRKLTAKKPVVVSMGSVAASGGYYVAASASRIVANPGTITGSIGVISQTPNFTEMAEKIGFEMNVVKSGAAKDTGNPFRPFSDDDRRVLQNLIDDAQWQFVRAVAEGRGLSEEDVRKVADGRVITGEQAKEAGLVDDLGNFTDAVEIAASMGEIEGEPELVYPRKPREFRFERFFAAMVREGVKAATAELRQQLQGEGGAKQIQYRLPGY